MDLAGDEVKKTLDFEGVEDTLVLQTQAYEEQAESLRAAFKEDGGGLWMYSAASCSGL